MPNRRSILIDKLSQSYPHYRVVLWADVPAGNQNAYRKSDAKSAYVCATPAELQAIRDGTVAEKVVEIRLDTGSMTVVQTQADALWAAFQAEVTSETIYADHGRYSNSSGAWQASPGVPMCSMIETPEGLPTFIALTPVSVLGANKFHLVIYNSGGVSTGQACVVKLRALIWQPGVAVVTGVAPGLTTLRRRRGLSTAPSGAGGITVVPTDSAYSLPSVVGCWNAPAVSPAGGTTDTFNQIMVQSDELKLSTADAATLANVLNEWGGQPIYRWNPPERPIACRAGETLELQQDATGGTGNGRALAVFTIG